MSPNNPYIKKVIQDTDIFHTPDKIYLLKWKWSEYFWNSHPLTLEIGTGMGNFFSTQVWKHPEKNFIGMEIRYKRCYQTAEKSRKKSWVKNFVVLKDFAQKIDHIFTKEEISETYIFFPDPWANKDRQRKHRLLQEDFLLTLYEKTKKWWKLFFKTDHEEYFESTKTIIESQGLWKIQKYSNNYENSEIFDIENITEFEWFYRWENTNIHFIELEK